MIRLLLYLTMFCLHLMIMEFLFFGLLMSLRNYIGNDRVIGVIGCIFFSFIVLLSHKVSKRLIYSRYSWKKAITDSFKKW